MSQRAAWQLERYGFSDVHDFVHGKAYWLASGRASVRDEPIDRVVDHLAVDVATVDPVDTVDKALHQLNASDHDLVVVLGQNRVVLGSAPSSVLAQAAPESTVAEVMAVGPTTIRPDVQVDAVRERMSKRDVRSLIVTRPTGELLGLLHATEGNKS
jgi:CBS domain-containing protein